MQEHILYKARTMQAKQHPNEYISIILDGMNTAQVPLYMPKPKSIIYFNIIIFFRICLDDCLKLHIHGIINHSFGTRNLLGSFDH
jgi:hypothetical protein